MIDDAPFKPAQFRIAGRQIPKQDCVTSQR
jgi:hypothetical protein